MNKLTEMAIVIDDKWLGAIFSNSNNPLETACPVCGILSISDRPPVQVIENTLCFSWDICPCCNFQYGLDEFDELPIKEMSLLSGWSKWRHKWLEHRDLTLELESQLRNIGLVCKNHELDE